MHSSDVWTPEDQQDASSHLIVPVILLDAVWPEVCGRFSCRRVVWSDGKFETEESRLLFLTVCLSWGSQWSKCSTTTSLSWSLYLISAGSVNSFCSCRIWHFNHCESQILTTLTDDVRVVLELIWSLVPVRRQEVVHAPSVIVRCCWEYL